MTRKCISCIYYSFLVRSNISRFMYGSDLLTRKYQHRGYVIRDLCDSAAMLVFLLFRLRHFSYLLTVLPYEMRCNSGQRFNLLLNLIKICLEFGVYLFCYVLFCFVRAFEIGWHWMRSFPHSLTHTFCPSIPNSLFCICEFVRSK